MTATFRAIGLRPLLVFEPLAHAFACFAVAAAPSIGWVYLADAVRVLSLAVGNPNEDQFRVAAVQAAGVPLGQYYGLQQSCGAVTTVYKEFLRAWLWSLHIDAPGALSGVVFLYTAVQLGGLPMSAAKKTD